MPEEDEGKLVRKNAVALRQKADGYYCDECVQFFGLFEQRYKTSGNKWELVGG